MDDRKDMSGRSSEEIRAEIDRTRADMHSTVDALEARLSPGQILDELWSRMRSGGAGSAGDLVREHPVPLALMGLGVAMLAVEHSKGHKHSDDGRGYVGSKDRAEGRVGPYRGDDVDHMKFSDMPSGIGSTSDGSGHGLKDKASGLVHSATDAVSGAAGSVADKVGDATSGLKDRASHLMDGASDKATDTARRAAGGIDRVIHDQPLIAGAITFGLGLAAGLAVPSTRFEEQRLGAASDHVKENVKQVASEVGEKALEVASQTATAVKDAAVEIKDEINDPQLKDALLTKARSVADVAKSTVGDAMENVSGAIGGAGAQQSDESQSDPASRSGSAGGSSGAPGTTGASTSGSGGTGSTP